ncbi:MAG: hypothetical protein K0S76_2284 [Herbinix sp.]|jgi:hypothetical protein|nr:hypothetical protein [Herbinix sp.]
MKWRYKKDAKRLLLATGVILILFLLFLNSFSIVMEEKGTVEKSPGLLDTMKESYNNIDKSAYDSCTILGSELTGFIKRTVEKDDYLAIIVITLEGTRTDYNYVFDRKSYSLSGRGITDIETRKAYGTYINQSAQFYGSVLKDEYERIIGLWFEQLP